MAERFSSRVVTVVGAGLAGSECAWQLAQAGIKVRLIEMRSGKMTAAHKTAKAAELVCSNSFGSTNELSAAPGQLKWEARNLGSLVLSAAEQCSVPAGQALGVDRDKFSNLIHDKLAKHPNILREEKCIESLDELTGEAVIATGPLTDDKLAHSLRQHFGGQDFLYFFDAIAPIIDAETINREVVWAQDRYDKGSPDYLNCPLDKAQYEGFIAEVKAARKITPHHFETTNFFESCMPIEEMIERGDQTLRFGPMKPVGLTNPKTGKPAYAVVQLRLENRLGTAYNMVGFQTRMAYSEQVRIFRMIPGLEQADFLKLGSIHRNLYVHSPVALTDRLQSRTNTHLNFAGQITGVEGYFDSTCIGLLVALFLIHGEEFPRPPVTTAMGALLNAITDPSRSENFQPTNIHFGLFPPLAGDKVRDKTLRKTKIIERAKKDFVQWLQTIQQLPTWPSYGGDPHHDLADLPSERPSAAMGPIATGNLSTLTT